MYVYLLFAQHLASESILIRSLDTTKTSLVHVHFLTIENAVLLFVTCL